MMAPTSERAPRGATASCVTLLVGVAMLPALACSKVSATPAPHLAPRAEAPIEADLSRPAEGVDLAAFERGRRVFEHEYSAEDGLLGLEDGLSYSEHRVFDPPEDGELGRDYNGKSCVACHNIGGTGGQGDPITGSFIGTYRFNTLSGEYPFALVNNRPFPLDPLDDVLGLGVPGYRHSNADTLGKTDIRPRLPPSLFGLGVLDRVPDDYVNSHCGIDQNLGIHGVPMIWQEMSEPAAVLRMGRRGSSFHAEQFIRSAFTLEMGVVNALTDLCKRPPGQPEISNEDIDDAVAFVDGLAPPPALPPDPVGAAVFQAVGCATCHDLSRQGTDQCIHDMGPALIDDFNPIEQAPNVFSWRTARLIGVRYQRYFLHDGRAHTVEEAVAAHRGEATRTIQQLEATTEENRAALYRYLRTL